MENTQGSQFEVTQDMLDTFLHTNKLDFTVKMIETMAMVGDKYVSTGGYAPMRTDTNEFLCSGGLSKGFVPIQNRDAFSLITQLSKVANVELKNSGTWGNGAGVFAQVSMGNTNGIGGGDDYVGKYLSVVNSHDGSRALSIVITPYRFYCANQIAKAYNQARKSNSTFFAIRHNASAEEKMAQLVRTVHIADGVFKYSEDVYQKLADTKINEEYVKETIRNMFPLDSGAKPRERTIWANKVAGVVRRYNDADDGRVQKHTAWNLYNAVQGTIQHDARNTPTKMRSVLMGDIALESARALTAVMEICSDQHIPQSIMDEIDAMVM